MTFFNIIFLGFLQGLTEFFPISSSGHLMIGKILLGIKSYGSSVDIVLHLGTLLSILIFWKKDLTKELSDYTFAPPQPPEWKKNPTEWLTSLDFIQIMKQYEKKYKCFQFIGPSPIDYDKHLSHGECVWDELCKFDLEKTIKRGITKIGVIFNTDPHDKEGAHWVSLFVNIKKREIYYFDSYGERTSKFINRFAREKIIKQGDALGIDFKYIKNKKRHQYRTSECGMYCLYFIIQMLTTNKSFESFSTNKIKDIQMIRLRKKLFNQSL